MRELNLTKEQLDVLKEIGNIGGGNAATALSQLVGKKISVDVPQVKLMPVNELMSLDLLKGSEELSIAVFLRILGRFEGGMLVLLPQRSALLLIDILTQRKIGSTEIFSVMDESALSETSHILCCSYLNAIAQFLTIYQLVPSITEIFVDKVDKLNKVLLKKFVSPKIDYVLPIENRLTVEGIELNLIVTFLLEPDGLERILKVVGL